MATRGFEFAYMLDGSGATPVIRDWPIGTIDANVGEVLTIDSGGYGTAVGTSTTEVLGVLMEDTGGTNTGYTNRKVALATRNQVWRCSMDATTTTAVPGYTKTLQFVDGNTIDANGVSSGAMILVDASETDDEGNVIGYVVFHDTTFGNA